MIFIILSTIIALCVFLYGLWKFYIYPWSHIPQPKGCLPILGHTLAFLNLPDDESFKKFVTNNFQEHGGNFLFWFLWKPLLMTEDLNLTKEILTSPKFTDKGFSYLVFQEWLGNGVFMTSGSTWRQRRKALAYAFHSSNVNLNVPVIEGYCKELIETLRERKNKTVDFLEIAKLSQLEVICEIAMGVKLNQFPEKRDSFIKASKNLCRLVEERTYKPWTWSPWIYKLTSAGKEFHHNLNIYNGFIKAVMEERLSDDNFDTDEKVFVNMLLKLYKENKIDLDGVLGEISTFMFAGHDTTASALAWTLYELGLNKSAQTKLQDEVAKIQNSVALKEYLNQESYLDCVIKETLRLDSVAENVTRTVNEEIFCENIRVPVGTEVVIGTFHIQRSEALWEDPLSYRPERFIDYNVAENIFKYIPFSAGPRNCIGKRLAITSLKLSLYYILSNFNIEVMERAEPMHELTYSSKNGIKLKFTERDN